MNNSMTHIKEMFIGVLVLVGFSIPFGVMALNAHENNEKVTTMNQICIEQGFDGWTDTNVDGDGEGGWTGCVNYEDLDN